MREPRLCSNLSLTGMLAASVMLSEAGVARSDAAAQSKHPYPGTMHPRRPPWRMPQATEKRKHAAARDASTSNVRRFAKNVLPQHDMEKLEGAIEFDDSEATGKIKPTHC